MMTRRHIRAGIVASIIPITLFAGAVAPACSSDEPASVDAAMPDPPNVVVIMVDDARVDDLQAMPQTRDFLDARYTNSYAALPVCCPSRATFLTGQYPHNNGVLNNTGPTGGADALDDVSTLPVWLQRDGYDTSMLGKYLNGYGDPADGTPQGYIPPGWSTWNVLDYDSRNDYTDFDYVTGSSGPDAPSTATGTQHVTDGYQTRKFTSLAVNHIKATTDPMFMWLSLYAPHVGVGDGGQQFVPAEPQYAGQSQIGLPTSPAVDERVVADKPPWVASLPRLTAKSTAKIVTYRRERRDALRSVDDSVMRIVDALRSVGKLGDTVIMFTSDNGFMQGEHRIDWGKTVPYLESAEVPLLVRGPGFTSGIHAEPVSNVDLAPTIADLAGVTPGSTVDGMSLLEPIPADRPILLDHPAAGTDEDGVPAYASVIQGDQYTEWDDARELYDLAADPWQLRNRANDTALRPVRTALAAELDRLRHCKGEGCLP